MITYKGSYGAAVAKAILQSGKPNPQPIVDLLISCDQELAKI